jgi:uncharacterized membrane protein
LLSVTLFSRENCHLCEQAEQDLKSLQENYPHQLYVIDINNDPDLLSAYGSDIPVIEVGPYSLKAPIDKQQLAVTLSAASDRKQHLEELNGKNYEKRVKRAREISKGDIFSMWFSKHYLLVFNLFVFVYVGLPLLAPLFLKVGADTPAAIIYKLYGGLCHQLSYRSWFLFGDQPIYPRELAGIDGYLTFHEATGLDEHGLVDARNFLGNDYTGFKIALCQRDLAIYGSILIFGLFFGFTGRRIKSLPFLVWLFIGILPIAFDGLSQLFGQILAQPTLQFLSPYFDIVAIRESTPFLRTLTGFLFGFSTAWFGYPLVEETMRDARRLLAAKFARIETSNQ